MSDNGASSTGVLSDIPALFTTIETSAATSAAAATERSSPTSTASGMTRSSPRGWDERDVAVEGVGGGKHRDRPALPSERHQQGSATDQPTARVEELRCERHRARVEYAAATRAASGPSAFGVCAIGAGAGRGRHGEDVSARGREPPDRQLGWIHLGECARVGDRRPPVGQLFADSHDLDAAGLRSPPSGGNRTRARRSRPRGTSARTDRVPPSWSPHPAGHDDAAATASSTATSESPGTSSPSGYGNSWGTECSNGSASRRLPTGTSTHTDRALDLYPGHEPVSARDIAPTVRSL